MGFIAHFAPPCVAEGLIELLVRSLMKLTGWVRTLDTGSAAQAYSGFLLVFSTIPELTIYFAQFPN